MRADRSFSSDTIRKPSFSSEVTNIDESPVRLLEDQSTTKLDHPITKRQRSDVAAEKGELLAQRYWQPLWLKPWFLVLVTMTCCALATGLQILYVTAKQQHGLALVSENHFTWTYAPTVVLVIMVALWRQIDFQCKSLTPWSILANRESAASETVLLDYVSPIQVFSLVAAIKKRHLTVVLGILGFMALKLAALASTGLLLPAPTESRLLDVPILKSASFNGSLVNVASAINLPSLFDSSLVYNAYGVTVEGLEPSDGIHEGLVFEPFTMDARGTKLQRLGAITAEVLVVVPDYHCEAAPVNILLQPTNTTDLRPLDTIQIAFPKCFMPDNGTGTGILALNPQLSKVPSRQLTGVVQRIDCTPDLTDNWQLITLSDFRYNQTFNESGSGVSSGGTQQALSSSTGVAGTTGVVCRSSYSIKNANITYDMSFLPRRVLSIGPLANVTSAFNGFSHADLGRLVTASLTAASEMFGDTSDLAYAEEYPNTLLKFMAALNSINYESLLNETVMIETAEAAFNAIAAQNMHKFLMQQSSISLIGSGLITEDRLQVNELSVWIMFAGLIVTIAAGFCMLFIRPINIIPRDPEPLATMGLLLAQRGQSQDVFRSSYDEGACPYKESLRQNNFYTEQERTKFLLKSSLRDYTQYPFKENDAIEWWRPIFTRRYIYVLCLSSPIIAIVILQVLQQISDRNDGIGRVEFADSVLTKSLTRYLPALMILLIATLINSIDFNIAVFAPFQAMSCGWASARESILEPALGTVPLVTLLTLAKQRNWGPLASAYGSLIASILSVVVAGLYVVEGVSATRPLTMTISDNFGITWTNSAINDNGAAVIMSLTESANLSYPSFTHEELAMNRIMMVGGGTSFKPSPNATVKLIVDARRADLNCTILPDTQFNVSSSFFVSSGPSATVEASYPLPPECRFGGPGGNESTLVFDQSFRLPVATNASSIGKILDLHVGPFDAINLLSSAELDPTSQKSNPAGCPSLAFIWGHVDINSPANTSVTTMVCYQQIDSIPTTVTLKASDLSVVPASPPVPIESQRTTLQVDSSGSHAFSFRPQPHFDKSLALFNQTVFNTASVSQSPVDNFFQAVLFGKYPMPQSYLGDISRQPNVRSGILGAYRRYMAQAISLNMRSPITTKALQPIVPATLTDPNASLRVKQNATSKLILQILLAIVFVCMSTAVKLTRMNQVLQHNPCTIAGAATLWAGSRFCQNKNEQVPSGAVWMGKRQLREDGVFDGWRFSLGWWDDLKGGRRWGIEGKKVRED